MSGDEGTVTIFPLYQKVAEHLQRAAEQLNRGERPNPITVRELLAWFNAKRRSYWNVYTINQFLRRFGLRTDPDFEGAYIDAPIELKLAASQATEAEKSPTPTTQPMQDPTHRIGRLAAANRRPLSVTPDDAVSKAVTLMLTNDFSQLPVMVNDRDLKGIITWRSIASNLALGKPAAHVRDCSQRHVETDADTSLFDSISLIIDNQYVLVRGQDRRITGIVTTSDLSMQFRQLTEPFLLLGEIENYVRRMIGDKYSPDELAAATDAADTGRRVENVWDLTMGEYIRLLEEPHRWERLSVAIDRPEFVAKLHEVRRIRNDVMHFDPDGIADEDLATLRGFAKFLQNLANLKVI